MALPQALPPAPPMERPRLVSVGTALAAIGVAMYFAGLIVVYVSLRSAALAETETWLQDTSIPLSPPNVMMVTLLASSVTAQWALHAITRADRLNAHVALGITLVFGVAVINSQAWMYTRMELAIADSVQAVLVYGITGSYIALVVVAMVYLGIMTFRTLGGQYGPHQHDGIGAAVMFWHVAVVVFAVIWYTIYITK